MSNPKIDVCVCLYGKPYHTILAIKSLLKYSRQHIGVIYVVVEKQQPQNDINSFYLLEEALKGEPVVFFRPKHFYDLGKLERARVVADEDYRHCIPYQYTLEKSDKAYIMVMHNDCLFHGDMVGKMLETIQENAEPLAGVGPIGQCWNCPAFFEKKCYGTHYDQFVPTQQELTELINRHEIPRREITERLIAAGRVHPLPECRLNEYAALINTDIYRKTTLPLGNNITFAGVWESNDWGTEWFYEMVNQGHQFKHLTLEDFATHAPFNPIGNGISAYSRADIYTQSEALAKAHLAKHFELPILGWKAKIAMTYNLTQKKITDIYLEGIQILKKVNRLLRRILK
jgi:hypothetical protein